MNSNLPLKRILLKLSGESLLGSQPFGIDYQACLAVGRALQNIKNLGIEVAVVIGGGNIFRGINLNEMGLSRTPADQMGMLATLLNGMALQQSLTHLDIDSVVMSALDCPKVVESYNWLKAMNHLSEKKIVIFVGGTGNPYFTTDTAAALRASEIKADALLKATKVDGIYSCDPLKDANAIKYDTITYSQMLAEKLKVMDATSVALCESSRIPIFVFNMKKLFENNVELYFNDLSHGTLVIAG